MVYIMSKMRASRRTKKLTTRRNHLSEEFGYTSKAKGRRPRLIITNCSQINRTISTHRIFWGSPRLTRPKYRSAAPHGRSAAGATRTNRPPEEFWPYSCGHGRWDESPAVHESALAIKPDRPGTLTWRGNLFMDPNRPAEALARFDGALAQDQSVWWRSATGVLHSRTSSASAIGDHEGSFLADTYELEELVRYYRAYETLTTHWRRVSPPNVILEVQYEDVVADLEGQAGRVVAHRGLEGRALPRLSPNEKASARGKHDASAPTYLQKLRGSLARMWVFLQPLLCGLHENPARRVKASRSRAESQTGDTFPK